MCRLVVTERATGPIWAMMTSQAAVSARAISDGPDTVPTGPAVGLADRERM